MCARVRRCVDFITFCSFACVGGVFPCQAISGEKCAILKSLLLYCIAKFDQRNILRLAVREFGKVIAWNSRVYFDCYAFGESLFVSRLLNGSMTNKRAVCASLQIAFGVVAKYENSGTVIVTDTIASTRVVSE